VTTRESLLGGLASESLGEEGGDSVPFLCEIERGERPPGDFGAGNREGEKGEDPGERVFVGGVTRREIGELWLEQLGDTIMGLLFGESEELGGSEAEEGPRRLERDEELAKTPPLGDFLGDFLFGFSSSGSSVTTSLESPIEKV